MSTRAQRLLQMPAPLMVCARGTGASVDSIDHWAAVVRALEARLEAARQAALTARSAPSFFAFFRSGMGC